MIIRVYETGTLNTETVGDMLYNADSQANFHPESRWIVSSKFATEQGPNKRLYREFFIKWIGRESVIMWLVSNQIFFEIISYDILQEEEEAIEQSFAVRHFTEKQEHLN